MNGLLCCAEILGFLLIVPWSLCHSAPTKIPDSPASTTGLGQMHSGSSSGNSLEDKVLNNTAPPSTTTKPVQTTTLTTTTTTIPTTESWTFMHVMKDCRKMIVICVALILLCAFLLIFTLALACKLCHLRRHLKATDNSYWVGMDKTSKSVSQPEANDNVVLLAEKSQANQETDNVATKEDGGKVCEGERNGEAKKVGDSPEGKEAAAAAAPESPPSSKLEAETTNSQATIAPPPPSTGEDSQEPKKEP